MTRACRIHARQCRGRFGSEHATGMGPGIGAGRQRRPVQESLARPGLGAVVDVRSFGHAGLVGPVVTDSSCAVLGRLERVCLPHDPSATRSAGQTNAVADVGSGHARRTLRGRRHHLAERRGRNPTWLSAQSVDRSDGSQRGHRNHRCPANPVAATAVWC